MSKNKSKQTTSNGFFNKYKELIITTVICLFLTGIYDSINTQTAEIKKWYQIMVNLQAEQKIQSVDVEMLKKSIDQHRSNSTVRHDDHESRIRILEFQNIPYQNQPESSHE